MDRKTIGIETERQTAGVTIDLQELYRKYVIRRWDECVTQKLQNQIIIHFYNGQVTSIQDHAIISGSTPLDIYTQKIIQ